LSTTNPTFTDLGSNASLLRFERFENEVLNVYRGCNNEGENYEMMNFVTCIFNRHYWGDQTKDIDMGGVRSTHEIFLNT